MTRPIAILATAALALAACADLAAPRFDPAPRVVQMIDRGIVERIDLHRSGSSESIGLGAVLGGIAGGVIGHQIGGGRGNDVATVLGAVGGAVAGNAIQKANEGDRYRFTVRLDNGTTLVLDQMGEGALRVGDRVRIVNNRAYRD